MIVMVWWIAAAFAVVGLTAGTLVLFVPRFRPRHRRGRVGPYVARRLRCRPAVLREALAVCGLAWIVLMPLGYWEGGGEPNWPRILGLAGIGVSQLPYVDDLLTGGERPWRLPSWARNRVKWRMALPAPPRPNQIGRAHV